MVDCLEEHPASHQSSACKADAEDGCPDDEWQRACARSVCGACGGCEGASTEEPAEGTRLREQFDDAHFVLVAGLVHAASCDDHAVVESLAVASVDCRRVRECL